MSLVQENPLWGPGEAVGIRVPGLVLPAQDRRGEGILILGSVFLFLPLRPLGFLQELH